MKPLEIYQIGGTRVEMWPTCVRTIFEDGSTLVAAPNGDDTVRDCLYHEIAHTHISWVLRNSFSPTLYSVANPDYEGNPEIWRSELEEDIVMAYVRDVHATGRGVPWDYFRVDKDSTTD